MFLLPGRRLEPGETIFTDWIYRGGDNVIIRAEAFQSENGNANTKITITFYTKNSEETGEGNEILDPTNPYEIEVGPFISSNPFDIEEVIITSVATTSATQPKGVEEVIRCKLVCENATGSGWVTARIFEPIFFDDAS
ncbi:MAG: hypothetical protein ACYS5W_21785 [Planctomycetota bacterium]|jgi:hypothetical protein